VGRGGCRDAAHLTSPASLEVTVYGAWPMLEEGARARVAEEMAAFVGCAQVDLVLEDRFSGGQAGDKAALHSGSLAALRTELRRSALPLCPRCRQHRGLFLELCARCEEVEAGPRRVAAA
jgi:hypothetical protein